MTVVINSFFLNRPKLASFANWIFQVLLVGSFLFFLGANTPHGSITLGMSPAKLIEILGISDAGSYLGAANDLATHNTNSPEWAWVLNLWPPGMVWLDALIIKYSPTDFAVTFAITLSLIWGTALSLISRPFLRSWKTAFIVVVLELLVLGTSPFQSWMFDEGLLYADGLAAGLLLIGAAIAANRARETQVHWNVWVRDGLYVGLVFAGAVYLRSSYQALPLVLGGFAFVVLLIILFQKKGAHSPLNLKQLIFLSVASLTTAVLLLPYTAYLVTERDRYALVTTQQLAFQSSWRSTETGSPQWLTTAGASIGCELDAVRCHEFYELEQAGTPASAEQLQDAYVEAVVENPLLFLGLKARYFGQQWFGDELSTYSFSPSKYDKPPYGVNASLNQNVPQGLFYAVTMLVTMVGSIVLMSRRKLFISGIPLVMALSFIAPFAIAHFEVRYLIPLKLLGLLAPVVVLTLSELKLFPFAARRTQPRNLRVEEPSESI